MTFKAFALPLSFPFIAMHDFTLSNPDQFKLTVQLEPWAELFYLRQGEELTFRQPASLRGFYHVEVYADGSVRLWPMGEFDYPEVLLNGVATEPWNDFE